MTDKTNYYKDILQSDSGNPKNTWKLIKILTNKSNINNEIIKHLTFNGKRINAHKESENVSKNEIFIFLYRPKSC